MSRVYTAPIIITTAFTAQIDIFELLAASGKPLRLLGWQVGQLSEIADAQEEMLRLDLKRITGAPTSGSGGGTSTFVPITPNDAAAGATLETGNTTKLTGGTSVQHEVHVWNVRQAYPVWYTPETAPILDAATRFVLELVTTPADSISTLLGWVKIEELV
jgi:hypothetical protein